jgi:capsular polysaccharide biosynthesis protein
VLAIIVLTILISGFMFLRTVKTYDAESKFITRQDPGATGVQSYMFVNQPNANWIGSEFLVDDYTQIVTSDAFAAGVLRIMGNQLTLGKTTQTVTRADIKAAIQADRKQRELHITVTGYSRDEAKQLSDAVGTVLTQLKLEPIKGQLADDKPVFTQIDEATPDTIKSSTSKDLINAVVRVVVGLAAAVALAFLLEYMDNSVRDERDAERVLGMPVIGTIPRS